MPNIRTHKKHGLCIGILGGISYQVYRESKNKKWYKSSKSWMAIIGTTCLTTIGAYVGSTLPDRLEPADHPNHRKFFHSWFIFVFLLATLYALSKCIKNKFFFPLVLGTILGYNTHLLADSRTPKGLPLI